MLGKVTPEWNNRAEKKDSEGGGGRVILERRSGKSSWTGHLQKALKEARE